MLPNSYLEPSKEFSGSRRSTSPAEERGETTGLGQRRQIQSICVHYCFRRRVFPGSQSGEPQKRNNGACPADSRQPGLKSVSVCGSGSQGRARDAQRGTRTTESRQLLVFYQIYLPFFLPSHGTLVPGTSSGGRGPHS